VVRPAVRLFAGTLALALPLAAAAGCGAAKKRTVKQEFSSAISHLEKSESVSLTLRLDDGKGAVSTLAKKDGSAPAALVDDLLGSSITYTFGPGGDKKLKEVSKTTDLKAALKDVRLGFVFKDSKAVVGEIRLVEGTLYARADVKEIGRVATEGGVEDFDSGFDDFVDGAPEDVQPALLDAKAGKWLKLPLDDYLDKLKDLAGSFPTPSPGTDNSKVAKDLYAAVKPFIKVTDANDSSSNRVLNVDIAVRGAAKALLAKLQTEKSLPFADLLADASPSDVDDAVTDGTAKGTITLKSGHLTQVAVDIESIRSLDPEAEATNSLAGSKVVLDIDDSAKAVSAPTEDLSSIDVKDLIDGLVKDFFGGFSESFTSSLSSDELSG
jgi:hypothetical protein